jgi:hypothetical protein
MKNEQKSDTSQILWLDAVVMLIIAVIAMVSNARSHIGLLIHHGR